MTLTRRLHCDAQTAPVPPAMQAHAARLLAFDFPAEIAWLEAFLAVRPVTYSFQQRFGANYYYYYLYYYYYYYYY